MSLLINLQFSGFTVTCSKLVSCLTMAVPSNLMCTTVKTFRAIADLFSAEALMFPSCRSADIREHYRHLLCISPQNYTTTALDIPGYFRNAPTMLTLRGQCYMVNHVRADKQMMEPDSEHIQSTVKQTPDFQVSN
jgi:hypothetical protein